jgi:hypothetical protein
MYMDHVRSLDWQPDYLIVIDVDVASFSVEGIMEAIEHAPEDWGGLFANGRIHYRGKFPCYYDLFAYIPERDGATFERKSNELYHETRLINRLIGHDPYLRCLSAFCGMGVYKWQAVKDLSYRTLPNTRSRKHEAVCEHIPFNMEVCAKGNGNYVCRSMWLNYGNIRTLKHLFIYSILPTRLFLLFYKLVKRKPFDD